jgi:hypothetical protein
MNILIDQVRILMRSFFLKSSSHSGDNYLKYNSKNLLIDKILKQINALIFINALWATKRCCVKMDGFIEDKHRSMVHE